MEIEEIIEKVLYYGPSIVSIITMIASVIVAIKKCSANVEETKVLQAKVKKVVESNEEIKEENIKLKQVLNEVLKNKTKINRK